MATPGRKAVITKGLEEARREGKMSSWTKKFGKEDHINPWSAARYHSSKAHFDPLEAQFYLMTWDGNTSSIGPYPTPRSWSTGVRIDIKIGDRILLLRQTIKPVGLIAIGKTIERPIEVLHLNPALAAQHKKSRTVRIEWDYFGTEPILIRADLPTQIGNAFQWQARGSGTKIRDDIGLFLDQEFRRTLAELGCDGDITSIDVGPAPETTEKQARVRVRIGQRRFRNLVLLVEKDGCRLTGIKNTKLLIASHIKPWKLCNNIERLDPHNGLMMTPAADHLFDMGLISFSDDGDLLISPSLCHAELKSLGIRYPYRVRGFTARQRHYLAHHRRQHGL